MGCFLILRDDARQMDDIGTIELKEKKWEIGFTPPDRLAYTLPFYRVPFIIGLHLPEHFQEEKPTTCQQLAETVLGTFHVASQ